MTTPEPLIHELAQLIVSVLNLDVEPEKVSANAPLFGEASDLGLDSIDALELALEIGTRYGFEFEPDDDRNTQIFASLRALAEHVATHRTK